MDGAFPSPSPVTQLLLRWSGGDEGALNELVPLVYDELRAIAGKQLHREHRKPTLPATAIVHEAYLRLVDQKQTDWNDRSHFFGVAARLIRQILVDHARARRAAKRGGGMIPLTLDDTQVAAPGLDFLELNDALEKLNRIDELQSRIVELRFFSGMTIEETATNLRIAPDEVRHEWTLARAWLFRELKGY